MFLVAYKFQSDKLTDISYAVTFATLAVVGFWESAQSGFHIVLLLMVCLWAIRIGGFLLYRVIKNGKDARFDEMRGNFWQFAKFWVAQAITVWALMIPAIFAFHELSTINGVAVIGALVWFAGLAIEATADAQKYRFSKNKANKNKWIQSGIWQYSRHPNYFGEILVWIGVYLYVVTALSGVAVIVALVSPLFITCLLLFVSGVPILEKSADKRWGSNNDYQKYKRETSLLVPLPRKKAR